MKALRGGNLRVLSAKRIGAAPHFGYHLEHRGYHSAIMFCMHLPTFAALCPPKHPWNGTTTPIVTFRNGVPGSRRS